MFIRSVLAFFFTLGIAHASMTMNVQTNCGLGFNRFVVEIQTPPGGFLPVSSTGSVTIPSTIPANTKLCALQVPSNGKINVIGKWTPATNGGILPVTCLNQ